MGPGSPDEYASLIVSALVFTIVLVSSFMCIQLFQLRAPAPRASGPGSAGAPPGGAPRGGAQGIAAE